MGYQPWAKILSLCIIIPLILFYSKLVDMVEKHKLFYIICTMYSIGFLVIAYLLSHPTIGLANTVAAPNRLLGWFSYITIESLGSIVVALFWSFVASSTDPNEAKKGFALIISGAQVGSIFGPTMAKAYASTWGLPALMCIAAFGIFLVPIFIKVFMSTIMKREIAEGLHQEPAGQQKPKTGMFEGLKLLLTKPYLLGVFAIATFYEVIGTIMDYQMKVLAAAKYTDPGSFTSFMGLFGQSANILALTMALLGTSYLMRRFGLLFCLLMFPIAVGCVISYVYITPTIWTVFTAMIMVKGLSYALNNPAKEMMYIPTSKDVKFKAKGWIDMFGSRSAKAAGSGINNIFKDAIPMLMLYGTLIALGLVGVWIVAAIFVGRSFQKLTKENRIIE